MWLVSEFFCFSKVECVSTFFSPRLLLSNWYYCVIDVLAAKKGLQPFLKRLQHRCFPVKFNKTFKNTYLFYRTPPVAAAAPPVTASVFFKKVMKQIFRNLLMTYFFFSTHRLMYKKSGCLFINLSSIVRFSK